MKQVPTKKIVNKIRAWRRRRRVQMAFAWGLVLLAPVLVVLTTYVLWGGRESRAAYVSGILLIDFIYLIGVIALVCWSVIRIYAARRSKSAGSRLHMRLSAVFALIALVPTVLVAVFAVLTLSIGVEGWFSKNVRNAVGSSLSAAEAYKQEQRDDLNEDLSFLQFNLQKFKESALFVSDGDIRVQLTGLQAAVQRGLKEAYVIDGAGKIRSRGEFSYLFGFEEPSELDMQTAERGETVIFEDWSNNEFRALVRLDGYSDHYLYISRTVDGSILKLLDDTTQTAQIYNQMETQRGQILSFYGLLYLGFASVVILSAIWLGMLFAERLARPVGRLAGAAQRVGAGDLDVQVYEEQGDDEIAMLSRVFNRMTKQVKRQRDDLVAANEVTDRRRRLFDSVLSGVTAGVIGLTADGKISVLNSAAENMLNLKPEDVGKELMLAVPEFTDLFDNLKKSKNATNLEEINLTRSGNAEVLLVRMATRTETKGIVEGYVITFDDVTDLVSAQRMAAWGDVARRIAHEIKNPLTPIQLSAERLTRKFGPLVGDKKDELSQYSDVIIRQTNDLRRIVDEFSKFARMPEPEKRAVDITKLISDAVLLQNNANAEISVRFINEIGAVEAEIDETMISQAVTNLIKNSGEAIETKIKNGVPKSFRPQIKVVLQKIGENLEILIQDNGIGFPKEQRSRLFEPYVTQRENGTGLGLSIVKKIIEEHDGTLELLDAPKFTKTGQIGAMARIRLSNFKVLKSKEKAANKVA